MRMEMEKMRKIEEEKRRKEEAQREILEKQMVHS